MGWDVFMAVYVVLLFDLMDAVVISADTIDASSRDDARNQANDLLRAHSEAEGYEIWFDGTKIASWFPGDSGGPRD